jgi:hypothetical protein
MRERSIATRAWIYQEGTVAAEEVKREEEEEEEEEEGQKLESRRNSESNWIQLFSKF